MNKNIDKKTRPDTIPIQLTKRDEKIIVRCFEDKLLSTSFLQKLYFPSLAASSRRLRILYSNHYLDRTFFSASPKNHRRKEAYYSLGKRGESLVALKLGLSLKQVKCHRKILNRQIKSYSILYTLAHMNTIAWTRLVIESAFKAGKKVKLVKWIPERLLELNFKDNNRRFKLRPDAFMQYKAFNNIYTAFLEIDLASESKEQIQDKVKRYIAFSRTELSKERFSTRWFRTLILTTSEQRSENIKLAIEAITDKIFWITDFTKIKDDLLFKPIFLKPGKDGRHPLISN